MRVYRLKHIFLLDSGANVSVVNQETYKGIPQKHRPPLSSVPLKLAEALGHQLQVGGICNLPILVGGQELMLKCMIVGGWVPKILRMNFMHELKVHADLARERYSWAKK